MTDILVLFLLILLLYGAKLKKPLRRLNTEGYLTLDTGRSIRGFFAVVVVLNHLAMSTETGIVFRLFSRVGYLAVAVFFFLSGYGLQRSYITKSDSYKRGFLRRRLSAVLIPGAIVAVFYGILYLVASRFMPLETSIRKGESLISHFWFLINILVFYVAYWVIMLLCGNDHRRMILCGTIWYILYVYLCIRADCGDWWYDASQLLIVGMVWATYEGPLLKGLEKNYLWIAPAVWIVSAVLFFFHDGIASQMHIPYSQTIVTWFSALFFAMGVILLSLKVQIGNKALGFLGDISLEMYLSHILFVAIFSVGPLSTENELLRCASVLAATILFSFVFHNRITKNLYLLLKKRSV